MNQVERSIRRVDGWQQRHRITAFTFGVIKKYGDDNGGQLVASLSHSAFVSLFPLLLVLTTILGIVAAGNTALRHQVVSAVTGQFPAMSRPLQHVHQLRRSSVIGLIVGLVVALWGSSGLAQSGMFTMAQVWNLPGPDRPGYWQRLGRAGLFLLVLAVGVIVTTLLTSFATWGSSSVDLTLLAVDSPGQEQKSTWLQVRKLRPDWIYMSGWGVMNQVAVKEAAAIGFKMDHFIGNWWSSSDADVLPAGDGAKGYKGATFTAPGTNFKAHADIVKYVYDKSKNIGPKEKIGEALYNRGVVNAMYMTEVFRTAMAKFGNKPLTTEQVRWGYEHFNLTEARLDQIGLKGFTHAVKVTCEDHEGNGPVLIQQWDGKKWNVVSEWIQPMREVVRPKLEAAAVEEGKKLGYSARDCSKEN